MRGTHQRISVCELVRAMADAGAGFFFTEAGSLFVANLGVLPTYLKDEFFDCNERELVRFLRTQASQAGGMTSRQANGYTGAKNLAVAA